MANLRVDHGPGSASMASESLSRVRVRRRVARKSREEEGFCFLGEVRLSYSSSLKLPLSGFWSVTNFKESIRIHLSGEALK